MKGCIHHHRSITFPLADRRWSAQAVHQDGQALGGEVPGILTAVAVVMPPCATDSPSSSQEDIDKLVEQTISEFDKVRTALGGAGAGGSARWA